MTLSCRTQSSCRAQALGALVLAVLATPAAAQPHGFRVGEPVPDRVLPSVGGDEAMSLADWRGEKLILHVFASW